MKLSTLQKLLHSPTYDPLFQPDYLHSTLHAGASSAAPDSHDAPLCPNREGWGPLSPYRYDFTPCFLDAPICAIAVLFGILLGGAAAHHFLRRKAAAPVPRNWHLLAKLAVTALLAAVTLLQAALQIAALRGAWAGDFRFWTTVAAALSLGVVGWVQWLEHARSRTPNAVVLFYWLLLPLACGVKVRSLVSQDAHRRHPAYFVAFCVGTGLAALAFVLEWAVPKKQSAYDALGSDDECPVEYADVFSRLTFGWMTPMMKYGYRHFLTQDDLWNLRRSDSTKTTGAAMEEAWAIELDKAKPSLWIAMFRAFGGPYFWGAVIKTVSDVLQFAQPQLLRLLIAWVDSYRTPTPQPAVRGVALALCMFAVSVAQSLALHQYFQRAFETGMRIRSSITAMIYRKSLRLSNEGKAAKSTGDIVNYMAVDTQRMQDLTQYGQQLWSAPFQIALCMASLYQLLGPAMLAGVGIMVLSIPLNGVLARYMKSLQKRQMKNKDARTRLMTEILNNMKSIKLYAWGRAFLQKLGHIRSDRELRTLRHIGAMSAVQTFTWAGTPIAVSTATFAVFVLTGDRPLSTELVFPALTLFNLLGFPLMVLPMVITAIIEAAVAVQRLTGFFTADELQPDAVRRDAAPAARPGDDAVRVRAASFTWDHTLTPPKPCLRDVDFVARKGELACVVGRVGSGKSSLLAALLGDIWKLAGGVRVRGATAYVAQQPWVMNASVRANIVFGHRWDPAFYRRAVRACALADDFKTLPDGDRTEVGEKGISLSGGQKARLTLARAVYARADVYLLDDVLSAVDQHVGRHLITHVLGPKGLLASKTRVLATNSVPVLADASSVTYLRDGAVVEHGTYEELLANKDSEIAKLVKSASSDSSPGTATPSDGSKTAVGNGDLIDLGDDDTDHDDKPAAEDEDNGEDIAATAAARTSAVADEDDVIEEAQDQIDTLQPLRPTQSATSSPVTERRLSTTSLRRASTASFRGPPGRELDDEGAIGTIRSGPSSGADGANGTATHDGTAELKTKQQAEHSEQGKVRWAVYGEYARASNVGAVACYLVAMLGGQTTQVGANLWLKEWAESNSALGGNPEVGRYIGIYAAFGVGSACLMVIQTLVLWIFCSIEVRSPSPIAFRFSSRTPVAPFLSFRPFHSCRR